MAKGYVSVYIRCPYYRREDRKERKIKCEGVVDRTELEQRFFNSQALLEHREAFCMGAYGKCPVAMALDRKYGYGGNR